VQWRQIAYMSLLTERKNFGVRSTINMPLERQEKLGVSGWVKVPVEKV
jgi:hypothetical protein